MFRSYMTPSNMLSLLRIKLVLPIIIAFHKEMFWWTLGLFLISAASDALDGWVARKWKMESEFGRMLDPLADKITFVTLIIIFSRHVFALFPVMILIVEEGILLVAGTCTYFKPQWRQWFTLGANKYGKIKTECETVLIALLIIWHFATLPPIYLFSLYAVLACCIIFALMSIIAHVRPKPLS